MRIVTLGVVAASASRSLCEATASAGDRLQRRGRWLARQTARRLNKPEFRLHVHPDNLKIEDDHDHYKVA